MRERQIHIHREKEREREREREREGVRGSALQCVVVCVRSTQIEAAYCCALHCVAGCCAVSQSALQGGDVC